MTAYVVLKGHSEPIPVSAPRKSAISDTAFVGVVATRLADALAEGDILYIARDEQRAETVAAALRGAASEAQIIHSPSSDALLGEPGGASPSNIGRRVAALRMARIAQQRDDRVALAFITTAEAAAAAYPAPAAFDQAPPLIAVGDELDLSIFAEVLTDIGYVPDDRVDEPGEMAVRGQVVDLFPADSPEPVRIELDGNRVVAIRRYDPVSQLGSEALEQIEIGRVVEPAVGSDATNLFDHLPQAMLAIDGGSEERRDRYIALAKDSSRHAGEIRYAGAAVWNEALAVRRLIDVATPQDGVPRFIEAKNSLRTFSRFAKTQLADGECIVIVGSKRDLRFLGPRVAAATGATCETIMAWREAAALDAGTIGLLTMPVDRGWQSDGITVIAAADLLGGRALSAASEVASGNLLRGELGEIRLGDVVVHEDFGIGRIAGVEAMAAGLEAEDAGDAIVLEYAGGARRLVSVHDADRLWRYGADTDAVTLDKLDGSSWAARRVTIDAAIAESARGLTQLATERGLRKAAPLVPDVASYERFSAGFAFTETPDQARAIDAVRTDLASGRPMDRLVVGDVGYGKTEVALRAVALAALAGQQVAIAAPTTVPRSPASRGILQTLRRYWADRRRAVAAVYAS